MTDSVRDQYERFPYPPVPWPALPRRGVGAALRFDTVAGRPHDGLRILVAGAGTLEALVVAQAHPRAAEVVAVELSGASVAQLRKRIGLARLSAALGLRRLPPIRVERADLHDWQGERFDYILASNLLHHLPEPAAMLARLAGWLADDGLLRLRTYPRQSRLWIRETGRWLRLNGVGPQTPRLVKTAHQAMERLPAGHPLRSAFLGHGERHHPAGLVDAFLHARENPLSPLAWQAACARAGLALMAEGQAAGARSDLLAERLPATAALDRWQRLQVLDDLLELTANPIFWLRKGAEPPLPPETGGETAEESVTPLEAIAAGAPLRIPSRIHWELAEGLRRAAEILGRAGVGLEEALAVLRREVGPRVDRKGGTLPGLSIGEYAEEGLLTLPQPWGETQWNRLAERLGPGQRLHYRGEPLPGADLATQAAWLQLRYGALESWLEPVALVNPQSPTGVQRRRRVRPAP
ncbi:methyltransferase [Endothiovibrio diazotrophicus]